MSHSRIPMVRLERQPHRNAVARLRQAYRRLRPARQSQRAEQKQSSSADIVETQVGIESIAIVQEISS